MVNTGIRSRPANRHGTEGQDCAPRRSFYAAGSIGRRLRQPVNFPGIVAAAGTLDVNLTGAGRAERKTNWQLRATNHTSVKLKKYAQRIGPAVGGVGVYEKSRHVDV